MNGQDDHDDHDQDDHDHHDKEDAHHDQDDHDAHDDHAILHICAIWGAYYISNYVFPMRIWERDFNIVMEIIEAEGFEVNVHLFAVMKLN